MHVCGCVDVCWSGCCHYCSITNLLLKAPVSPKQAEPSFCCCCCCCSKPFHTILQRRKMKSLRATTGRLDVDDFCPLLSLSQCVCVCGSVCRVSLPDYGRHSAFSKTPGPKQGAAPNRPGTSAGLDGAIVFRCRLFILPPD